MRKLFITGLFSLLVIFTLLAQGKVNPNYHYVQPHYRNGSYVQGHYRTNPNSTNRDNYSTRGNTNPWTLEPGTIPPDNRSIPSYSPSYTPSYTPSTYKRSDSYSSATNVNINPSYRTNESNTLLSNFFNTPTTRPSSYSTLSYPTYRALDFSAGERVINYSNGRDEFNVAAPIKIVFNKELTYYSFDPYDYELKENVGGAEGKLLLDGPYRFYDEEGRLRNAENYRKGLKHGKTIVYEKDGSIAKEAAYTFGRLTYQKFTTDEGVTFEVFGELNKPGTRLMLYQDGSLYKMVETISTGLDKHTVYNPETQRKELEYHLREQKLEGTLRRFQADGLALQEVANYKNGLLDGESRIYDENGKLKEKYSYKSGEKSGPFEIYNEAGMLTLKGALLNDSLHGQVSHYDASGTPEYTLNYDHGRLHGSYRIFQQGKLMVSGLYQHGEKDGLWNYYWKDSTSYYLAQWFTYKNGAMNGPFREIRHDSVVVGTYKNGLLDGEFRIYHPLGLRILGIPPKDLSEDELECAGAYSNGKRSGHWKCYSHAQTLVEEGDFYNDEKHSEWRYYFDAFVDYKNQPAPYSGQLYLIENYLNGKRNGRSERIAYLDQTVVPCDTSIGTVNPLDTCFDLRYRNVREVTYYKNDLLHGPLEWRDGDGNLVLKGEFRMDQKFGHWTEIHADADDHPDSLFRYEADYDDGLLQGAFRKYNARTDALLTDGAYIANEKAGTWKQYFPDGKKINRIITYEKGLKNTEKDYIYDGRLYLFANYVDGFMNKIEQHDTAQNRLMYRFDILFFKNGRYDMDVTMLKDTSVQLRIQYSPGYGQPEDDPFLFVGTYELLNIMNPDKIVLEGPSSSKIKDGKVLAEGAFHENARQGEWRYFFYDQNILRLIQYEANEKTGEQYREINSQKPFSGKFILRTPEDGGYLVIKIKKGLRQGPTLKYDREGKLVKKTMFDAGKKNEK